MAFKAAIHDHFSLEAGVQESLDLLQHHTDPHIADRDASIPNWVIAKSRGVAFLFTYKVGVFASASGGSGIVIAKRPGSDHWGLPIAVGLGGGGGGFDFGVAKSYQIVVLNNDNAVKCFCQDNVKLGLGLAMAAGPVGRQAEGSTNLAAANNQGGAKATGAFTYGYTKGLFAGVGVQGMWVTARDKENAHFYQLPMTPRPPTSMELLYGNALAGRRPTPLIAKLQSMLTHLSANPWDSARVRDQASSHAKPAPVATSHRAAPAAAKSPHATSTKAPPLQRKSAKAPAAATAGAARSVSTKAPTAKPAVSSAHQASHRSPAQRLQSLKDARTKGLITQREYDSKRAEILKQM